MRDYIELTKPRITWLILMSTGIGYFFGLPAAANWREFLTRIDLLLLFHTVFGTGLIAAGTAALNQWYEREGDGLMNRTKPSDSFRSHHRADALAFGIGLSVAGFLDLWLGVNLLTAAAGAVHAGQLPVRLHAHEARSRYPPPSARSPARCLR